jgi:hypothetical protein
VVTSSTVSPLARSCSPACGARWISTGSAASPHVATKIRLRWIEGPRPGGRLSVRLSEGVPGEALADLQPGPHRHERHWHDDVDHLDDTEGGARNGKRQSRTDHGGDIEQERAAPDPAAGELHPLDADRRCGRSLPAVVRDAAAGLHGVAAGAAEACIDGQGGAAMRAVDPGTVRRLSWHRLSPFGPGLGWLRAGAARSGNTDGPAVRTPEASGRVIG